MTTQRRVVVPLLVAAVLLLHQILVASAVETPFPAAIWYLLLGYTLGQTACLTIWLVFGRTFMPARLCFVLLALFAWSIPLAAAADSRCASLLRTAMNPLIWSQFGQGTTVFWTESVAVSMTFLLCHAGVLAVACFAARCSSWRIVAGGEEPARARRAWQYSFAMILSLMTCVAILMAVGRHVELPGRHAFAWLLYAAVTAGAASILTYVTLGIGRTVRDVVMICGLTFLVCPLVGLLLAWMIFPPRASEFAVATTTEGLTIVIVLHVIRVAGYRLIRSTAYDQTRRIHGLSMVRSPNAS